MQIGHGSTDMKSDAASLVNHVLREASFQRVVFDAGITDEAMGAIAAEDFFVRVMVVLHGNQAHGPIWTKPGGSTFAKGVVGPRESPAKELKPLPFFDQPGDRVRAIIDSAIKLITPIFDACVASIHEQISGDFLTQFLHIG